MAIATVPALNLYVTPLSPAIGAEVRNVDLKRPLDDELVRELRHLLLDHKVLFFPQQHLTPAEHAAFAAHFGELTAAHPVLQGLDDHPEVFEIDYSYASQFAEEFARRGSGYDNSTWHTDVTFVERPPLGSVLNAVEIPEAGGDTQWSNQAAAFAALSEPLQRFLSGLTAEHSGQGQFGWILDAQEGNEWEGAKVTSLEPVSHPVVRTHEETGERVLFVNPVFTTRINELSARESDALLTYLYDHASRPEFTVRYHWRAGDLAFWDNRATQHSVVPDFAGARRVIQRVTIRGSRPE